MELVNIKHTLSKISLWKGDIDIEPLEGGLTNKNYLIKDKEKKYVARFGEDIIYHHVLRYHEIAASKAANIVKSKLKRVIEKNPRVIITS